ncbi:ef-hand calcium-binding domain-containing [Trichoderma arundinaceum]|uniref:Ef-hand calcium-binding domain-containing n=1 Tax=Trichoderma arundinaceum TaxID=490622 RepID=A0A395NRL9_TRIAR|nr:ef-hand calcium-binding domain-containing [Trichoderma arundinaceum]
MKILCLHGAFGSASNFKVQLGIFTDAVTRPGVEFKWINGFTKATPPPGFDDYFGAPPLFRFMDYDGVSELEQMVVKIRDMPQGSSPEETMRKLVASVEQFAVPAVTGAMSQLVQILDEDPEIDASGILGYSEGATTAATLILEEQRLFKEQGRPRRIKCAIFFAGWPPVRIVNGRVETMLADEYDEVIDIPTCHVVGCNDPYIDGAVALYGICNEDEAILFDHGKGHTVPRDETTVRELTEAIESTFAMVM